MLTTPRDEHDQELDSLLVGPIPVGVNKFIFEADPPKTNKIPDAEILGVTVILLTCAYDSREFVRVGYYVNNEYESDELNADPPAKPILEKIRRNVLAEKPRVTRFAIKWLVLHKHCYESSANVQISGTLKLLLHPSSRLSSLRLT
jgi:histone chaperone ASF1